MQVKILTGTEYPKTDAKLQPSLPADWLLISYLSISDGTSDTTTTTTTTPTGSYVPTSDISAADSLTATRSKSKVVSEHTLGKELARKLSTFVFKNMNPSRVFFAATKITAIKSSMAGLQYKINDGAWVTLVLPLTAATAISLNPNDRITRATWPWTHH
ncbi:hypothetical protein [Rufibacter latericius]|uniref:Uncharacterized protein n=1 Tax=Rufibacter latericius TaxID=2487040 RepID=A0A3M9MA45_9BACT|nr:hypothetical protein [Rufibacter latericius]RNI22037.1 hypothetical protein EFB08_23175 [Rufibacter latericius]